MRANINKFSFGQLTSNNDGKTSGSGTMGVLICTIGTLCFLLGCIDKMFINKDIDVITQSIILVGIGAALLGHRNHVRKGSVENQITDAVTAITNQNTISPDQDTDQQPIICDTCGAQICGCQSLNS
jgi:hypothetical protein